MTAAVPLEFETPEPDEMNGEAPSTPPPDPWATLLVPVPPQFYSTTPPRREWLLRDRRTAAGVLPRRRVGIIAGAGGVSKTMSFVQLAISVATGTPWLGAFDVAPEGVGRSLLLLAEEDMEEVHRRVYHARAATNAPAPAEGSILVMALSGCVCTLVERDERGNPIDSPYLVWLRERAKEIPDLRFIAIDPLSRFAGLDAERDNALATRAIEAFESLAVASGATVIAGHHSAQWARGGSQQSPDARASVARGVTALTDGARWVASMTTEQVDGLDPDSAGRLSELVTIAHAKSNYSRRWEPVTLRRDAEHGGALVPLDDADREIVADAREQSAPSVKREAVREGSTRTRDEADDEAARQALSDHASAPVRDLVALVRKSRACGQTRAHAAVSRVRRAT